MNSALFMNSIPEKRKIKKQPKIRFLSLFLPPNLKVFYYPTYFKLMFDILCYNKKLEPFLNESNFSVFLASKKLH